MSHYILMVGGFPVEVKKNLTKTKYKNCLFCLINTKY